jgi:hypothetical protein
MNLNGSRFAIPLNVIVETFDTIVCLENKQDQRVISSNIRSGLAKRGRSDLILITPTP